MATSSDRTFDQYCEEIVTNALVLAEVVKYSDLPSVKLKSYALSLLNLMVNGWQTDKVFLWTHVSDVQTALVASTKTYALSADYLSIKNVRQQNITAETEIPLTFVTRDEFAEIPDKSSTGVPLVYTMERSATVITLRIWPVPTAVDALTYQLLWDGARKLEYFKFFGNTGNFPSSWLEACTYGLAARLNSKNIQLQVMARQMYETAKNSDYEGGSIQFCPTG